MTTLGQVKINGQYDTIALVDPTSAELEPVYTNGHRWLNFDTGDSFELTDQVLGTWTQIETSLDFKINNILTETYNRILKECEPTFFIQRQVYRNENPDTITKTDYYLYKTFVSVFADWTISGAEASSTDVSGELSDFDVADEVIITGSKRNDGLHTISTVDTDGFTFISTLTGTSDIGLIALAYIPDDFNSIVGRMVYYDVVERPKQGNVKRETIGSYSYELDTVVGGLGYPAGVASGIDSYISSAPYGVVEYMP